MLERISLLLYGHPHRIQIDFSPEAYKRVGEMVEKDLKLRAQYLERFEKREPPRPADILRNALRIYDLVIDRIKPGEPIKIMQGNKTLVIVNIEDLL